MKGKAIFFDRERCFGCGACVIACKAAHNLPPHPLPSLEAEPRGISFITIHQYGPIIHNDRIYQFFQPISCMHCAHPPCIEACPQGAIYRDGETGAVLVDGEKCIGCRYCLWVCPYGAPRFGEDGRMVKCDLCIERLKAGKRPACEVVCPARAVIVGSPEEIARLKSSRAAAR